MIDRRTLWAEVVSITSCYYPTLGARESSLVMTRLFVRCQ